MRVRLVIFDLDGTLLDSESSNRALLDRTLRQLGVTHPREELDRMRGQTLRGCYERLAPHLGVDDCLRAHIANEQDALTALRPFPDAVPALRLLHGRKTALAVQTSRRRDSVEEIFRRIGFGRFFPVELVLTFNDVRQHKPHPEGILSILARTGIEPDDALYVGDTEVDAAAAKAAGVHSSLVHREGTPPPHLAAAMPDHHLQDLRDIARHCR